MEKVEKAGDGRRLDLLLAGGALSRSRAARLIREGQAKVSGAVETKPSFIPKIGDKVELSLPEPEDYEAKGEDIPISILYEDEAMAVVVKPAGLVVHPAAGNPAGTLVNALLYRLDRLSGIGGQKRPGIVHRLDKDTSGLMLVAKNDLAHLALSRALARREIAKTYLAVVAGSLKAQSGTFDGPIGRSQKDRKKMAVIAGGRAALTYWQAVRQETDRALVLVRLITGRTHQIRVHFAHAHHPVLGDVIYGHKGLPSAPRLMLHAWSLAFKHPITGVPLRFAAPPDACFGAPGEAELERASARLSSPDEPLFHG